MQFTAAMPERAERVEKATIEFSYFQWQAETGNETFPFFFLLILLFYYKIKFASELFTICYLIKIIHFTTIDLRINFVIKNFLIHINKFFPLLPETVD